MICFDSELFPQNFVWQLNNDRKSLKPHRNCQIKSSKWLYFSFHMSQRINNIQFYSYESIFPTNFKCSKHFALKKSSELWHSSSSRKGRLRIAAFQSYNSKDYDLTFSLTIDTFRSTGWNQIDSGLRSSRIPYCRKSSHIPKRWRIIRLVLTCWCPTLCQRVSFWPGGWFSFDNLLVSLSW